MKDYATIAEQYAKDVVAEKVVACLYVKQACQRHLDDLAHIGKKGFPFHFDAEAANRVCGFVEFMPCTKGIWAAEGKRLELERWQIFITCCVFGWYRGTRRRFRFVYIEVPRGNGKTEWSAAIGNYMLVADGEVGAEVYCGATTEKQADIAFTAAKTMARRTPDLKLLGVEVMASNISIPDKNSKFEKVIGKPGDGAAPSFSLIDELHEHKSDELIETMKTGMLKRQQPIMWIITTAGWDLSGPCYAFRKDVMQVLNGKLKDDSLFGIIYTVDEGDQWHEEASIRKANPNFGISVNEEIILEDAEQAIQSSRKQNAFKTKHLNIWVGASSSWMNMEKWAEGAVPDMKLEDFKGESCWLGVDLSQRNDFTSVALLFKQMDLYYLFTRHYLPATTIDVPENRHYQEWTADGYLISVPGNVIDYDLVLADILEDDDRHRIISVGYDKRFAHQFAIDLVEHGINAVEVPQTYAVLTEAMADLEGEVLAGRLFHDNNPVMNWHMDNTILRALRRGGTQGMIPGKESDEKKIDGVQAAVTAMVMEHTQKLQEKQQWPDGLLVNF